MNYYDHKIFSIMPQQRGEAKAKRGHMMHVYFSAGGGVYRSLFGTEPPPSLVRLAYVCSPVPACTMHVR